LFSAVFTFSVIYTEDTTPVRILHLLPPELSDFASFYADKIVEPYFDSHPERNVYITLLQSDPPAPDSLLKAALVRRAVADVHRVLRLREDKPALQNLLQKGSVGEDLWNSLLAAEKELEAEITDVVAEANSFVEGWGTLIFPTANEIIANEKTRYAFDRTAETRAEFGLYTLGNVGRPCSRVGCLERKYKKAKVVVAPAPTPTLTPPPTIPASPVAQLPRPQTPLSAKSGDSLVPPPSAGAESASSDGEAHVSPTQSNTPHSKVVS
jgi:translocation protein SEC66